MPDNSIKDSEPQIENMFDLIKKATAFFADQQSKKRLSLWRSGIDSEIDPIYSAVALAIETIDSLSADNPEQVNSPRKV